MSRLLAKSEPMHTKQTSKLGTPSACSAASSVQSAICALVTALASSVTAASSLSTIMTSLPSCVSLRQR